MELLINKAKKIRLLICDVDGVLTSGLLFYGPDGTELKAFNVQDGLGLHLLQASGVEVAIITARESYAVTQRMQDLKIKHVYQNQPDKVLAYEDLKKKLNLTDEEIAYIGDDLPDLPLLRRCGFAVTVANAPNILKDYAHWITSQPGGHGAARELCEFIMHAQDSFQPLIDSYVDR